MYTSKDIDALRNIFSSHKYVMTTAELKAAKLYYADIQRLVESGLIEKVKGVFIIGRMNRTAVRLRL